MRGLRGMTVLEMMIVLAIVAGTSVLARSAFRLFTKADLVENATELAAILRRTSALAIEHGEMHRVTLDLDKQIYVVEVCQGATAIQRNEKIRAAGSNAEASSDRESVKRALERGKDKMQNLPLTATQMGDPEEVNRKAAALSGHHVADRVCAPATDSVSGDAQGKGWARALRSAKGIKFKEVWVQHRDEGATKGQLGIYFFATGRSEKAVVELTDGSETFSVLVYGLTARVELKDGALGDVNDHMMRNAIGDDVRNFSTRGRE